MRVAVGIVGLIGTLLVLATIVRTMLVAHSSRSGLAGAVAGGVAAAARLPLGLLTDRRRRNRWLAGVAPVTMLLQLTLYAVLLIGTLGLMVYGTTSLDLMNSLYQSGATFTTLGIVLPVNPASTVVTFVAAFLGLVLIAVFVAYLMSMYGMYAARETVMARLSTWAGEPAWGPEMLARAAVLGRPAGVTPQVGPLLDWLVELRLNTQVNPVLATFRSTSDDRHWTITLLAALDAVALRLAMGTSRSVPDDVEFLTEGAVTLGLLAHDRRPNWPVEHRILAALSPGADLAPPESPDHVPLTDVEWADGWRTLTVAGLTDGLDERTVRCRFELIRGQYVAAAYSVARHHHAVRAPWSGPRHPDSPVVPPLAAGADVTR